MVGRKPIPTELKELAGNPGHRPLPEAEPRPTAAIPRAPDHLDEVAQAKWQEMGAELLALGLISKIDEGAFAVYCDAWSTWVRATKHIQEEGDIIFAGKGRANPNQPKLFGDEAEPEAPAGFPMQNPWVAIAAKAMERLIKIGVEFGMTPSSRSRVSSGLPKAQDETEKFLFGQERDDEDGRSVQ